MLKIFWFTLLIGMAIFFISYIKIREKISTSKRDKFEKVLMILLLVFLLLDIALLIFERRETTMEANDCIRFYKYFPYFYDDSEFYFVNEWCYKYFSDVEIEKLRRSGIASREGYVETNELLKGWNYTIIK